MGCPGWSNLDPRCRPDHKDKTKRDREAGLIGSYSGGKDPP